MSDAENDDDGISAKVRTLLTTVSDDLDGVTADQVAAMFRHQYDIDPAGITDDDAEALLTAWEDENAEEIADWLMEQGVPEGDVQLFLESVEERQADDAVGTEEPDVEFDENGRAKPPEPAPEPASNSPEPSDATKQFIRQEVRKATPSAGDIARQVQQQMAQNQSGGDGDGGLADSQTQNAIAQALVQNFLGDKGGGPMAEMGEQLQKASMQRLMSEMTRPRMGEMIEFQMNKQMAEQMGEKWAEHYAESMPDPDRMFSLSPPEDDDETDG